MAKFYNLLVIALVLIRRTHKARITDRGAENPTGPKLPDFTLSKADKSHKVTSDEYDLYFFTGANRGCFDNVGLNFFQKRSGMHRFCLTLPYESTHVK